MKIIGTPDEIKKLLDAITGSKEQPLNTDGLYGQPKDNAKRYKPIGFKKKPACQTTS